MKDLKDILWQTCLLEGFGNPFGSKLGPDSSVERMLEYKHVYHIAHRCLWGWLKNDRIAYKSISMWDIANEQRFLPAKIAGSSELTVVR